jgi:hypothetical protein
MAQTELLLLQLLRGGVLDSCRPLAPVLMQATAVELCPGLLAAPAGLPADAVFAPGQPGSFAAACSAAPPAAHYSMDWGLATAAAIRCKQVHAQWGVTHTR